MDAKILTVLQSTKRETFGGAVRKYDAKRMLLVPYFLISKLQTVVLKNVSWLKDISYSLGSQSQSWNMLILLYPNDGAEGDKKIILKPLETNFFVCMTQMVGINYGTQ